MYAPNRLTPVKNIITPLKNTVMPVRNNITPVKNDITPIKSVTSMRKEPVVNNERRDFSVPMTPPPRIMTSSNSRPTSKSIASSPAPIRNEPSIFNMNIGLKRKMNNSQDMVNDHLRGLGRGIHSFVEFYS